MSSLDGLILFEYLIFGHVGDNLMNNDITESVRETIHKLPCMSWPRLERRFPSFVQVSEWILISLKDVMVWCYIARLAQVVTVESQSHFVVTIVLNYRLFFFVDGSNALLLVRETGWSTVHAFAS